MTNKPNPDELLELIQEQELNAKKGKLKIFFGMCAGVGKTYAMLDEAHRKQKEGVQVVIGVVNTHGRRETEELVQGLPIIPLKKVPYRGAVFEEFDIDTILELKPQLVLIDELAHSNIPSSRHRKRWQDVEEILDAGIDVYTTLNVQHIESRKGIVESIADVLIHETVPDSILERANTVSFIDIPPEELLERLREGKVYTGELSKIAVSHFFKQDNLTALREIALRLTAEKVEHDLHGLLALEGRGWKTREKLLVAVNANPASEELIRATRKRAFELDAPWICLHVETDTPLTEQEQERLKKYTSLARELGAEVINIQDIDIASAINNIVKQKEITQIIIGRSPEKNSFFSFFKRDLAKTIEEQNKNVDILILRQNRLQTLYEKIFPGVITKKEQLWSRIPGHASALMTVAALTLFGKIFEPWLGTKYIGFLLLLGVLSLSFFVGIWEILFAAFLSALSLALFFDNSFSGIEDGLFIAIFFLTASLMGFFMTGLRRQQLNLRKREESLNTMVEIERQMGAAKDLEDLKKRIIPKLIVKIPGEYDILSKDFQDSSLRLLDNPNELAIATWVLQNGKMAGWSTNTLSSAQALYFPIKFKDKCLGVFIYQPAINRILNQDEMEFLLNIVSRLGVFMNRMLTMEEQKGLDFSNQLEQLHQGILRSVSRSFYTPLEKIFDAVYKAKGSTDNEDVELIFEQTANSTNDLKIIIENIITIAELESGRITFEISNHSFQELISTCKIELFSIIGEHEFVLDLPKHPPLLPFDFRLMKMAVKNILINAIENSPSKAPVRITLAVQPRTYTISIIDQGSGIPEDLIPFIFNKFYKAPYAQSQGLGIGLTIVRSIIDLHNGSIVISSAPDQGTKFTLILPI